MQGAVLPNTRPDAPMGPGLNFSSFRTYNAPVVTPRMQTPNTQHLQNVQNTLPQGYNPYADPAASTSQNWAKKHFGQSVLSVNSRKEKQYAKVDAHAAIEAYNQSHHKGVPVKPGNQGRIILLVTAIAALVLIFAACIYFLYFQYQRKAPQNLRAKSSPLTDVNSSVANNMCQQGFFLYGNKCITCPPGSKWSGKHCIKPRKTNHLHSQRIQ